MIGIFHYYEGRRRPSSSAAAPATRADFRIQACRRLSNKAMQTQRTGWRAAVSRAEYWRTDGDKPKKRKLRTEPCCLICALRTVAFAGRAATLPSLTV